MDLVWIVVFILLLVLIPLYICWSMSGYRNVSRHGFFLTHISIFLDERSFLLRKIFRKYLGLYHEYRIYSILEKLSGYKRILINLYIPQGTTITDTEIDILFIHESGIYCIEAKDLAGSIYGYEDQPTWTQRFGKRIAYSFQNPIHQNFGHIRSLKRIISEDIISLIIFSWRSKLLIRTQDTDILKRSEVKKYFKEVSRIYLTKDEIDALYTKLVPYAQVSKEQESTHIREIREKYSNH